MKDIVQVSSSLNTYLRLNSLANERNNLNPVFLT